MDSYNKSIIWAAESALPLILATVLMAGCTSGKQNAGDVSQELSDRLVFDNGFKKNGDPDSYPSGNSGKDFPQITGLVSTSFLYGGDSLTINITTDFESRTDIKGAFIKVAGSGNYFEVSPVYVPASKDEAIVMHGRLTCLPLNDAGCGFEDLAKNGPFKISVALFRSADSRPGSYRDWEMTVGSAGSTPPAAAEIQQVQNALDVPGGSVYVGRLNGGDGGTTNVPDVVDISFSKKEGEVYYPGENIGISVTYSLTSANVRMVAGTTDDIWVWLQFAGAESMVKVKGVPSAGDSSLLTVNAEINPSYFGLGGQPPENLALRVGLSMGEDRSIGAVKEKTLKIATMRPESDGGIVDASTDSGVDTGIDSGIDAGTDAGSDAGESDDAGADAEVDAGTDAGGDAGIDSGMDAGMDAGADGGADAGPRPLKWISIPAGNFSMGCSTGDTKCDANESPVHTVTFAKGFDILETEVTQAQYQSAVGANPSYFKACGTDCPVDTVTYAEAENYCGLIGGRLPSEAEWEYAVRAGTTTIFYCGNDSACLESTTWIATNSGGTSHKVALKAPNAWGLYDMMGNVGELTQDLWHYTYNGAPTDGSAWTANPASTSHVYRGGSWAQYSDQVRSSRRASNNQAFSDIGFRCARSSP